MFTRKQLVVTIAVVVLLPVLLFIGYEVAKNMYFHPSPPEANFPPPEDASTARQQDLEYFRHFLELDRSYTDQTRAAAGRVIDDLQARLAGMSDAEVELGIARAVALADNGHTSVWIGARARRLGRLPIRGHWFSDGFYILRAREDLADLLGGRVTHFDATPIAEVYDAFRPYSGGTDESYRARSAYFLEVPALLHALQLTEEPGAVTLTIAMPDGSIVQRRVETPLADPDEPRSHAYQNLSPEPVMGEKDTWRVYLSNGAKLPLYLKEINTPFRHEALEEIKGYYVQYRQNFDSDGYSIEDFNSEVREAILAAEPEVIVVDQRFNSGGDYTKTMHLMSELPSLVPERGRIYLVTDRETFSAGMNSVAFVMAAGGDKVTIIGSRVGDRERQWGETNRFVLPNSQIGMTFATGMHDMAGGCTDWKKCYWTNIINNVAVGSMDPDIEVNLSFQDYAALRDPLLDRIYELESGAN